MKKQTLTILVLAAVSLFLISTIAMAQCPNSGKKSTAKKTVEAVKAKADGETITLSVSNMTCGACVNQVTKALSGVEGVKDVTVSLKEGKAEIICESEKVKAETLTAAVVKAGYPAKLATADAAVKKSVHKCGVSCAKSGCDPSACGMKKTAAKEGDSK